jgi:RNA polymerase-binding transcription factor DksA
MYKKSFSTFLEASSCAKKLAKESGSLARIFKAGDAFIVEIFLKQVPSSPSISRESRLELIKKLIKGKVNQKGSKKDQIVKNINNNVARKDDPTHAAAQISQEPRKPPFVDGQGRDLSAPREHAVSALMVKITGSLCHECGQAIPVIQLEMDPNTIYCLGCQSRSAGGSRYFIDEGIAGTREENKRMRARLWGEMRSRGRGK